MSSNSLGYLNSALQNQFNIGDPTNRSLDIAVNGNTKRFGALGDFANKFDQTQERKYVQEGYFKIDPQNASPKLMEIFHQQPEATILVKKKMFSSLSENYQLDHLDADEKLFYKSAKLLFANKAKQISAIEKLSKISEAVSATGGNITDSILQALFSITDEISNGFGDLTSPISGSPIESQLSTFTNIIDTIKKVYLFSDVNTFTTWIKDTSSIFKNTYADGTGVIEFCNITGINTNTTIEGGGNASFTISDPYNLMLITDLDIEKCLSDALNPIYNINSFQFGIQNLDQVISDAKNSLGALRDYRNVGQISFHVNENTYEGKKVQAIIDSIGTEILFEVENLGTSVKVDAKFILNKTNTIFDNVDNQSLNNDELNQFKLIIISLYSKIQLAQNSARTNAAYNEQTNYARSKLRGNFLGKHVIQSMDQVHIYMKSNKKEDTVVLGGFKSTFSGLNALQSLNNSVVDLKNSISSIFSPGSDPSFQVEKAAYVGSNFPNWLWNIMKPRFVNEQAGIHTFGGLVDTVSGTYRAGSEYSLNVSCHDMMHYLSMGQVNFKPSVTVYMGELMDPLTIFKSDYGSIALKNDGSQMLLDENNKLLQSNLLRAKAGKDFGRKVNQDNFLGTKKKSGEYTDNSFYSPDGFVHRWKQGISVSSNTFEGPTGNPKLSKDPFSGQDIMNIISLSITGVPYNYNTFYKASQLIGNLSTDPQTGEPASNTYITSLQNDIKKTNQLWGNFVPFKKLVLNEEAYNLISASSVIIANQNSEINNNLTKLSNAANDILAYGKIDKNTASPQTLALVSKLQTEFEKYNAKLKDSYNVIDGYQSTTSSTGQYAKYFNFIGDDVSFDYDSFLNSDANNGNVATNSNTRDILRKKLDALTLRKSYDVRSNQDKNLFIVDDSYDKDYDLSAFNSAFSSDAFSNLKSEYSTQGENIKSAAQILNLEVFCDTQGHIRARPPQYNKMPSSVFYRLMKSSKNGGPKLLPKFVEDLYSNQIDGLLDQVAVAEAYIRLNAAFLGKNDDLSIAAFINNPNFTFISKQDGTVPNVNDILKQSNPDSNSALSLTQMQTQSQISNAFSTEIKAKLLANYFSNISTFGSGKNTSITPTATSTTISNLIKLLATFGKKVNKSDYSTDTANATIAGTNTPVDLIKVTAAISENIKARQASLKLAAKAIRNAQEALALDSGTGITNKVLAPDLTSSTGIPSSLAHLIEDETYDDLGPGSGSRFIIQDAVILSLELKEQAPNFTAVEVKTLLNVNTDGITTTDDNVSFSGSGSIMETAFAVDYDMWHQYGFKTANPVSAPFLSDVESQGKPYAASILSRIRRDILRGSVDIIGNEYMQPGDVVYIETRGLLFYVERVQHEFSFGGKFNTKLELSYGHAPGEYIPTTLDLIGKLIYNNKNSLNTSNRRQARSANETPLGCVLVSSDNVKSTADYIFNDLYKQHNKDIIKNMLQLTQSSLSLDSNSTYKIELRCYFDSTNPSSSSLNEELRTAAVYLATCLQGKGTKVSEISLSTDNIKYPLPSGKDLGLDTTTSSPSQKAWDAARNINGDDLPGELRALYTNIIDCWLVKTKKAQ
jgi:hypothetical protein